MSSRSLSSSRLLSRRWLNRGLLSRWLLSSWLLGRRLHSRRYCSSARDLGRNDRLGRRRDRRRTHRRHRACGLPLAAMTRGHVLRLVAVVDGLVVDAAGCAVEDVGVAVGALDEVVAVHGVPVDAVTLILAEVVHVVVCARQRLVNGVVLLQSGVCSLRQLL